MITKTELDKLVEKYETIDFIKDDPIQFCHRFSKKEEIELALKASKVLGCEFSGVDLMHSKKGLVICEVNSNAQLKNIYNLSKINSYTFNQVGSKTTLSISSSLTSL